MCRCGSSCCPVSNTPERLAHRNRVACTNRDAALTHVAQQDPHLTATQDHVMAGHVGVPGPSTPSRLCCYLRSPPATPIVPSHDLLCHPACRPPTGVRPPVSSARPGYLARCTRSRSRGPSRVGASQAKRGSGQRLLPEAHFEFLAAAGIDPAKGQSPALERRIVCFFNPALESFETSRARFTARNASVP